MNGVAISDAPYLRQSDAGQIEHSGALFDKTEKYRYRLWRIWDNRKDRVCFVLLNPSTADASHDDPTLRRCIGFARKWGYGGLEVVNLFAFRTSTPENLRSVPDPVGRDNDAHLRTTVESVPLVVFGWGCQGEFAGRDKVARNLLQSVCKVPHCLGKTKKGHPRHPLYVPGQAEIIPWTFDS